MSMHRIVLKRINDIKLEKNAHLFFNRKEAWVGDGENRLKAGRAWFLEQMRRGEGGLKPSKFSTLGKTQRVFESPTQAS